MDLLSQAKLRVSVTPRRNPSAMLFRAPATCTDNAVSSWPLSTRSPAHRIDIPRDSELPTVLMLSNLYDPATPAAMSHQLHEEFGWDRSILTQTVRGGHTIYFEPDAYEGETVAAINRYLLDLELPQQGTVFYS